MCPSGLPPERTLKHALCPALQPLIPSTLSAVSQLACSVVLWPVCGQCLFPFLPLPLCLSSFALYFSIIHNFFHLGKVEHLALKRRVPECLGYIW